VKLLERFSLLRRIAKAEERQADALERIATVAEDTWSRKHAPRSQEAEIGTLDLDYLNERFEKEQEARDAGLELEEHED
jgi:hypothetical protein